MAPCTNGKNYKIIYHNSNYKQMKALREVKSKTIDQHNKYEYLGFQGEVNTLPGKTIPDQSLTVRQIMQRHTAGVPLNVKTPNFNNDTEIDNDEYSGRDPRTMDLTEIHDELESIAERQKARIKLAEDIKQQKLQEEERLKEEQMKARWIEELKTQKPQE